MNSFNLDPSQLQSANPQFQPELMTDLSAVLSDLHLDQEKDAIELSPYSNRLEKSWIGRLYTYVDVPYDEEGNQQLDADPEFYLGVTTNTQATAKVTKGGGFIPENIELEIQNTGKISVATPEGVTEAETLEALVAELPKFAAYERARREAEAKELAAKREAIEAQLITPDYGKLEAETETNLAELFVDHEDAELLAKLQVSGLGPQFKQALNKDNIVYYSGAFRNGDGHSNIMAYVNIGGAWKPQLFYTSSSQGCWRWLPGYDKKTGWYCKGQDEVALTPAPQIQDAMYGVVDASVTEKTREEIDSLRTDKLIVPPVRMGRPDTYSFLSANFVEHKYVDLSEAAKPDFSKSAASSTYRDNDPIYGDSYTDNFVSLDGAWSYSFGRNTEGLAWLKNVTKTDAKIRLTGLVPDEFARLSYLLQMPAYDYPENSGMGNGKTHPLRGEYVEKMDVLAQSNPEVCQYYKTIPREQLAFMSEVPQGMTPSINLYLAHADISKDHILKEFPNKELLYEVAERTNYGVTTTTSLRRAAGLIFKLNELDEEHAERAGEKTQVSPMEPLQEGTPEHNEFITVISALGFTKTREVAEKYDEDVHYEYWQSPQFEAKQVVVAVANDSIIDISPIATKKP